VIYVLITLHVIVSVFLILVVLLQQGKGADLSVFGGGSTQAAFGARGAATLLHKLTVGGFILFTLTTLTIQIMKGRLTGSSVLSGVKEPASQSAPATPGPTPATPEGSAPETSATGTEPAGTPPASGTAGDAPPAQPPPAEAPTGT
jgi:preprotein translocase subunit SecG